MAWGGELQLVIYGKQQTVEREGKKAASREVSGEMGGIGGGGRVV